MPTSGLWAAEMAVQGTLPLHRLPRLEPSRSQAKHAYRIQIGILMYRNINDSGCPTLNFMPASSRIGRHQNHEWLAT
jgi:hypothetical protein